MRKNYFLMLQGLWVLIAMMAVQTAQADVSTIADLYGKYHFTATVDVKDATYAANWSDDCEVIITKDEYGIFDAQIENLAGAKGAEFQKVTGLSLTTDRIRVTNPNGSNGVFGGGIYMADETGAYPFGGAYGPIYYNFDRQTKTITLPDFTLVTVNHAEQSASVVAVFTNAKMELIEAEKISVPDITGVWNYKNGTGTYDSKADSPMGTEFTMELSIPDAADSTVYEAKVTFDACETVTLPAKFDGNQLAVTFDSTFVNVNKGLFLGDFYSGKKQGSFSFIYVSESSLAAYSGIAIYQVTDTVPALYQYMMSGRATREVPDSEKPKWDGSWTVKANIAYNADGGNYPTEFPMTVVYYEVIDAYYITEFWGNSIAALNYGGIPLTLSKDDAKQASIPTDKYLKSVVAGETYQKLFDMNLSNGELTVTVNDDGTLTISPFCVATIDYNNPSAAPTLNVYYDNVTATKVVPTLEGKWKVTATLDYTDEAEDYPTEFPMQVIDYGEYGQYLSVFWSTSFGSLNYGGVVLTIADDGLSATFPANKYLRSITPGELYLNLYDYDGGNTDLSITLSADGKTATVSDFCIGKNDFQTVTPVAKYKNVTATKISDEEYQQLTAISAVHTESEAAEAVYSLDGKRIEGTPAKGIYIIKRGTKAVKAIK